MSNEFQVIAKNPNALFTLKLHRGDGMTLLAMNWKAGEPPLDFVGFAIEYKEPKGDRFWGIKNRISFADEKGKVSKERVSSRLAPFQKFRWVHFPVNAELEGEFVYRVTPVFMSPKDEFSYGEPQEAAIELARETYPGQLNVCFTRGFVSSQAFVDRYVSGKNGMSTLIPSDGKKGLAFVPTHPKAEEALEWMGFEARSAILEVLDKAIKDKTAQVRVVCYDLNDPAIVSRLENLGDRLKIIIDDSDKHGKSDSAETKAAARLAKSTGSGNVKRQHMGSLQHNKTIVVKGRSVKAVVCGSTNFSWRGEFVQSNNAIVLTGSSAVSVFLDAFESYWAYDTVAGFGPTASTGWKSLGLPGVKADVTFSPHTPADGVIKSIGDDIRSAQSSVFYSLAFLYITPGAVTDAIKDVTKKEGIFVYGMSDKKTGGLNINLPNGKKEPVYPSYLEANLPEPFKSEPSGGSGARMHHKFIVIDFDKPTARVYTGSYNFSKAADVQNGENLLLIKDRRIAVSYMIQALTLFDHYQFRLLQEKAAVARKTIQLQRPPKAGEQAWWQEDYTDELKALDRKLFA